jgi:hypothetical protein
MAMTRRRKLALVALVAGAAVVVGLLTNSHWKVYGWVRGEPFWRGLPASYYASQAGAFFSGDRSSPMSAFERFCRQRLPTTVTSAFWPANPPFHEKGIIIKREDTDVIPVLLHMTHHPRTNVRWWATSMLCLDLPLNNDAIARLIELLDDPQAKVNEEAAKALSYMRRAAQGAIPKLREKSAEARRANPASAPDVFTKALEKIDPDGAKYQP